MGYEGKKVFKDEFWKPWKGHLIHFQKPKGKDYFLSCLMENGKTVTTYPWRNS